MIEVLKRNPAIDGWSDNYKRLLGNCLNGLTVREVRRVTVTKATIQALDGVILSVSLVRGWRLIQFCTYDCQYR